MKITLFLGILVLTTISCFEISISKTKNNTSIKFLRVIEKFNSGKTAVAIKEAKELSSSFTTVDDVASDLGIPIQDDPELYAKLKDDKLSIISVAAILANPEFVVTMLSAFPEWVSVSNNRMRNVFHHVCIAGYAQTLEHLLSHFQMHSLNFKRALYQMDESMRIPLEYVLLARDLDMLSIFSSSKLLEPFGLFQSGLSPFHLLCDLEMYEIIHSYLDANPSFALFKFGGNNNILHILLSKSPLNHTVVKKIWADHPLLIYERNLTGFSPSDLVSLETLESLKPDIISINDILVDDKIRRFSKLSSLSESLNIFPLFQLHHIIQTTHFSSRSPVLMNPLVEIKTPDSDCLERLRTCIVSRNITCVSYLMQYFDFMKVYTMEIASIMIAHRDDEEIFASLTEESLTFVLPLFSDAMELAFLVDHVTLEKIRQFGVKDFSLLSLCVFLDSYICVRHLIMNHPKSLFVLDSLRNNAFTYAIILDKINMANLIYDLFTGLAEGLMCFRLINQEMKSAFYYAVEKDDPDLALFLISLPVYRPDMANVLGVTPIHILAEYGTFEVFKAVYDLVMINYDVILFKTHTNNYENIFHCLMRNSKVSLEFLQFFLDNFSDLYDFKNFFGQKPIDLARMHIMDSDLLLFLESFEETQRSFEWLPHHLIKPQRKKEVQKKKASSKPIKHTTSVVSNVVSIDDLILEIENLSTKDREDGKKRLKKRKKSSSKRKPLNDVLESSINTTLDDPKNLDIVDMESFSESHRDEDKRAAEQLQLQISSSSLDQIVDLVELHIQEFIKFPFLIECLAHRIVEFQCQQVSLKINILFSELRFSKKLFTTIFREVIRKMPVHRSNQAPYQVSDSDQRDKVFFAVDWLLQLWRNYEEQIFFDVLPNLVLAELNDDAFCSISKALSIQFKEIYMYILHSTYHEMVSCRVYTSDLEYPLKEWQSELSGIQELNGILQMTLNALREKNPIESIIDDESKNPSKENHVENMSVLDNAPIGRITDLENYKAITEENLFSQDVANSLVPWSVKHERQEVLAESTVQEYDWDQFEYLKSIVEKPIQHEEYENYSDTTSSDESDIEIILYEEEDMKNHPPDNRYLESVIDHVGTYFEFIDKGNVPVESINNFLVYYQTVKHRVAYKSILASLHQISICKPESLIPGIAYLIKEFIDQLGFIDRYKGSSYFSTLLEDHFSFSVKQNYSPYYQDLNNILIWAYLVNIGLYDKKRFYDSVMFFLEKSTNPLHSYYITRINSVIFYAME